MNLTVSEPTILAIDTSCDETSVAVTRGVRVLSNALYSSMVTHAKFGGVVPNLAKLAHEERIDGVIQEALDKAGIDLAQIDLIAVTYGPGLAIALEVGINKAKELSRKLNKPLVAVNHMEGHLLSALAEIGTGEAKSRAEVQFPNLALLVSGGHTELVLVKNLGEYEVVGQTLDDACGEAYDKCGRMLGLNYPAGPEISRLAAKYRGNLDVRFQRNNDKMYARGFQAGKVKFELPVSMVNSGNLDVSYSGLKTAFKRLLVSLGIDISYTPGVSTAPQLDEQFVGELCVVFEASAQQILLTKLKSAIEKYQPKEIWLGGGVAASERLREQVSLLAEEFGVRTRLPEGRELMVDNAAMIGVAASFKWHQAGEKVSTANKIYTPETLGQLERDPIASL